jgi:hypothetical protein
MKKNFHSISGVTSFNSCCLGNSNDKLLLLSPARQVTSEFSSGLHRWLMMPFFPSLNYDPQYWRICRGLAVNDSITACFSGFTMANDNESQYR